MKYLLIEKLVINIVLFFLNRQQIGVCSSGYFKLPIKQPVFKSYGSNTQFCVLLMGLKKCVSILIQEGQGREVM